MENSGNTLERSLVDATLEDAFDAWEMAANLAGDLRDKNHKREAERIALSLKISLREMAAFGLHAPSRWEELSTKLAK